MLMDPSSDPQRTDTVYPADAEASSQMSHDVPVIRRQSAKIIEAVLSGSAPEQASARDQLREHLAAHPGRPDIALAEHLATFRSLTTFPPVILEAPEPVRAAGGQPPAGESSLRSDESLSARIEAVLRGRMLVTAFQPIHDLGIGGVVGAEALTRFVTTGSDTVEDWFAGARDMRLGSDLEFAALESALTAAKDLPDHLYVALKRSPSTCLDPLLAGLLERSGMAPERIVLELTEALTNDQPAALVAALAPLRHSGVRLAVDHAGSYFASMRHIRHLRPEIIKLDRNLIAGIDTDTMRHALGEALVGFAEQIGAVTVAQGIETCAELEAVTDLGLAAGQGYLLGRPTTLRADWKGWNVAGVDTLSVTGPDRRDKT